MKLLGRQIGKKIIPSNEYLKAMTKIVDQDHLRRFEIVLCQLKREFWNKNN